MPAYRPCDRCGKPVSRSPKTTGPVRCRACRRAEPVSKSAPAPEPSPAQAPPELGRLAQAVQSEIDQLVGHPFAASLTLVALALAHGIDMEGVTPAAARELRATLAEIAKGGHLDGDALDAELEELSSAVGDA